MHSSGSIIKTYLEKLRHYLDDPDLDAKYDNNYLVRFFLSSAMSDVIARVSMMADNQIMCLLNVSVVSGTTYYKLPPSIKQVLRIGIQDPATGWFIEDFKPRNEFSLFGPGWALEGNLLSFRPTPSQNQTYLVLYVPSGDVQAHYGSGILNANGTFTMGSTPTIGSLDKRDNAYAGSYLRIFGTNLIDELIITSHDPTNRVLQLRNPSANAAATYDYEVVPFLMEPMTDAISLSAAMRAGVGRKISNAQLQALSFEYKQAIKTAHDTLGNMNARIGKRFTGTVDPVAGFTVGGSGSGATTGTCAPCGNAGGDLGGSYPSPTVDGLQGRSISALAPSDGQVLTWVAASSAWVPVTPTGGGGGGSGTVTSITPAADSGTGTAITTSGTITVAGTANEVTTSVSGTTVTVGLPDEVTVVDLNTDRIDFNTSPASSTSAVGRELWDTTWNTLSLGLSSNVDLKEGQQLYLRGHNSTGSQIDRGKVVYVSGGHATTEALIALADADAEGTSANTVGVAAENIAHGSTGLVQVFGYMSGLTTNGYSGAEGSALYLSSTPGDMSSTLPTQPKHGFRVALIVKKAGSGSIFISPQNYQELEELSDVLISGAAEQDLLSWDNTALVWKNRTIANAGVAAASHVHGNISSAGAIGSTANLPLITTTSGVVTTGTFGTAANSFCQGNDSRLSDARTPTSHTHGNITNDGKIGSTSGLVVVTTSAGAVTTLADGSANTYLKTNGSGTLSWASVASSGSVTMTVDEFYNDTGTQNSTTWTKPSNAQLVILEGSGGGGGGGNGSTTAAGVGGCAGVAYQIVLRASSLASTETVTCGAGGGAGADGGATTFYKLTWAGGRGATGTNNRNMIGGTTSNGFGAGGTQGNDGKVGGYGPGGGGGGATSVLNAGAGGKPRAFEFSVNAAAAAGGAAGATGTGAGTAAAGGNNVDGFGEGGGGGGYNGAGTGGAGGAGLRGSGGGGGGQGSTAGGAGASGGAGYLKVITLAWT